MQFKHPEILWALFLLIIPVLIHLFQLRRFKKTPFTNVAMLQKVVAESRKSNTLKKWLLLATRLLLLASLIIAFAQPFSSAATALQEKEMVIYLDNSFSMQTKNNGVSLLEKSVQDLIRNIDREAVFSLFTNEHSFRDVDLKDVQNQLLSLSYSHKQLNLDDILLKANTLFSKSRGTVKNLLIISDFQQRMASNGATSDSTINSYYVPVRSPNLSNVSIDSIYLDDDFSEQSSLTVLLSGGVQDDALPISLYNGSSLIAKSAAKFSATGVSEVIFSIPNTDEINGRLVIADNGLGYDNQFYFNIDRKEKVKVLAISSSKSDYLKRLYTEDDFDFRKVPLDQLDYSSIDEQNTVILDNLRSVPNSLQQILLSFKNSGGTIVVIPSEESELASYNDFLSGFSNARLIAGVPNRADITSISFDHPLYKNVFERRVTNFQYPKVEKYYRLQSNLPQILSFGNNEPFLVGINGFYCFTSSLETENSNFTSSPLIVPTFYNMAMRSLQQSRIQHTLGQEELVDIPTQMGHDDILRISKGNQEFIPLQQNLPNKVRLTFDENPTEDGIYTIKQKEEELRNISFNYPRTESRLVYLDTENLPNTNTQDSIAALFNYLDAESNIAAYWKWFVILALLFALIEVIIQKFIP
ncbi:BatA domain-containing protein [Flagellimonas alvinocaridis]|uniref:BatA domain-containing protein n=1 Tax=Flavobacteriaceae TaxID=49546 RepID=UPI00234A1BD2|nr:BatA domain-containing protein [Muricauda sp. SP22]MDC6363464.1 BatA domain-containing protein [Muricauda sp. SP22]